MSECLQAVVAAALAVQASAPIVLNRHLHWKFHMRTFFFFCSLSLISILSAAWHLTQLHFYLRQRTDKNYGSQSWPTRYAFSRSWFNYCLLMVQANKPWTHSHYFQTILHKQRNWFPWLRTHTHIQMQKTRFHWETKKQTRPQTRLHYNNHLTHTQLKN